MLFWLLSMPNFNSRLNNFQAVLLLCLLLITTFANAHTWIEQMQVIGPNGSYVGDYGYPRGYMARTDPAYDGFSDKWQIPSPDTDVGRTRINGSMFACHKSQRKANYTEEYPKLQVAPGSYVAMKYLENGHVTQPWIPAGKPDGGGTVWVFGTYEPKDDQKLVDVLKWTTDGKGGDGKGWMMTAQNYDDGRCHQLNQAPISINRQLKFPDRVPGQPTSQLEQWCETDLHIPENTPVGKTLSTYWVWSWSTQMQTEGAECGKDEYYTTCSDFDVVDGGPGMSKIISAPKAHTIGQQDPQSTAVSGYMSRTAISKTPIIITTQSCSYTTFTSSSLPATLTQLTTMPTSSPTSTSDAPMPTYAAPAPGAGQAAGNAPAPIPSAPAPGSRSTAINTPPYPTTPAAGSAGPAGNSTSNSTIHTSSTVKTTPTLTSTIAQGSSPTVPSASGATVSSGTSPSITFSTKTVYDSSTPGTPAPSSEPSAAAAIVRSGNNNVVELGKRSREIRHPHARRH